jgi:PAS domain S-box-containing protein
MRPDHHVTTSDDGQHAAELLELGDALCEVDRAWRVLAVNRNQERLYRRPRGDTLGRVLWELWPEAADPGTRYWVELNRCMRERVAVQFQDFYAPLDLWAGVTAYPVSAGGIAIFSRDITALKRAEEAVRAREAEATRRAAEMEAILGSVADGVLVYDAEGRIVRSNAAADAILGYGPPERATPVAERIVSAGIAWLHEDGSPMPADEMPAVRATRYGETHRGSVMRMRRPEREQWIALSAAPLLAGGVQIGAVVSISDITARKSAERALQASERRLRRMIDLNPIGVVHRERGGGVRYANDAYLRLVGATRAELEAGRLRWDTLTAPEHRARDEAAMAQADAQGISELYEKDYVLGDGRRVPLLVACASMGDPGETMAFVIDLTDRKRAEEELRESEQRFRMLAEAMPQIVCVLDSDGTAEYVNPGWTSYSGLDFEETKRAGWAGVLHPDDLAAARACRRRMLDSRAPQDVELRYRAADGSYRWFLSRLAPVVEGGRIVRLVGTALDIEDRKRAEEALRRANQTLRDADRRKDEFLGMLSHELRNPLAPIRNSLYILGRLDATGVQARRAKDVANRQVAHLTSLVDDLLDVTRIARGKIELRRAELDVAVLARRAAEDHRALMQERHLELALEVPDRPVIVHGDGTRLSQVLGNLLHNAAKFTPAGGRVTLAVAAEEGRAVIHVRDTGSGIAPEALGSIFEPFTQAEQTLARSEGGLGLGLALVKGLVTLHGGEVSVSSAGIGRGADFVVTLPLASPARARRIERVVRGAPLRARRRVLVIDDNRDAADSLAELVSMLGHRADVAYDGFAGLARAAEAPPDVVLCDIGLPGMDGYECARQLRALAPSRHLRLVAVSGYAQPEDVARAMEAGFDAHVAKPADPERIAGLLSAGAAART